MECHKWWVLGSGKSPKISQKNRSGRVTYYEPFGQICRPGSLSGFKEDSIQVPKLSSSSPENKYPNGSWWEFSRKKPSYLYPKRLEKTKVGFEFPRDPNVDSHGLVGLVVMVDVTPGVVLRVSSGAFGRSEGRFSMDWGGRSKRTVKFFRDFCREMWLFLI